MGLATDIVESSAKAMVHVLNSIWRAEQVEKEKQKIDQCSSVCRFWIPSTIYLDVSSDYTVYLWDLDHIYRLEWISNAY